MPSKLLSRRKSKQIMIKTMYLAILTVRKSLSAIFSSVSPIKMKRLFHICISSHDEVITRNRDDVRMITNLLGLSAFRTDTEVLADAIMSSHLHGIISAEKPKAFAGSLHMSLSRWFNHKYDRKGPLGESSCFILKLDGLNHIVTCACYVLKNGVHHFQAPTAFAYKDCTAPYMFMKELGRDPYPNPITSRSDIRHFFPKDCSFPDNFITDREGMLLRTSFEEILRTEGYFGKVNNFLHKMARSPADNRWKKEQETDGTGNGVITLGDVEPGYDLNDISRMESMGDGYYYKPGLLTDIDVCQLIDSTFLASNGTRSVYSLSSTQKNRIARTLKYEFHLPERQISRCLAMQYQQ